MTCQWTAGPEKVSWLVLFTNVEVVLETTDYCQELVWITKAHNAFAIQYLWNPGPWHGGYRWTFRNLPYWKSQLSVGKLQLFRSSSLGHVWHLRFTNKDKKIHLTSLFPMNFSTRRVLTSINFDNMFFPQNILETVQTFWWPFPEKPKQTVRRESFCPSA